MWDPIIKGCTTSTACNYNPEAKEDDNSCIDPLGCDNWCPGDTTDVKELDCAGVCGGIAFIDCTGQCGILVIDECGICGGNNAICTDCNGVVNGDAFIDSHYNIDDCKTNECVGGNTGLEACIYDCTGNWGGSLIFDQCGECGGDNSTCTDCYGDINGIAYLDGCEHCVGGITGLEECGYDCAGTLGGALKFDQCGVCGGDNSTCTDCNGDINGIAYLDGCGDCVGGITGLIECTEDCTGLLGGTSFYDNCGICVLAGDTTCIQGCDGIWKNDGSQLMLDECEVCGGNNSTCIDCAGTPNGTASIDNCEECVSAGDTSCIYSCDGSWVNDGSQAVLDECNVCGGDNTVCAGCDGLPNSGLEIDVCGMCGGDDTCLPENCTDDNVSGYCQDLSVLQKFIDNSSGTLNMDMDDNGNGVIEPLELGYLDWFNGRLVSLLCSDIGLSGEIPSEIGNLMNLTYLSLVKNNLTEEIPSEIGNLVNLTTLILSLNQLTGSIPSEIGNLGNLTNLTLSTNELTGEIPSEIGNLMNLTKLKLHTNNLTGEIPSELWNLVNLHSLYLQNNELTGEIPPEIGNLVNINDILLSNNQLTGSIPSEIGNLDNLSAIWLNSNELKGEIPNEICNLDVQWDYNLLFLISYNNLCPYYPSCIADYVGEQDISECPETTVTDYDGNTYETVQIDDQIWMVDNLKVAHYNNGDEIPTGYSNLEWIELETGAYAVYNDNPNNTDVYGNLYNWYVADDDRGVCPEDFHVPSDEEFMELEMFLGMSLQEVDTYNYRGTDEGSKLAGNADLWSDGDLEINSEFGISGFNALPSGYRRSYIDGAYLNMAIDGCFWSFSESVIIGEACYRALVSFSSQVKRKNTQKQAGFSIRCLKD